MRDQVKSEARGGPFFSVIECVNLQLEEIPGSQEAADATAPTVTTIQSTVSERPLSERIVGD